MKRGRIDTDLIRYLPGMMKICYQGLLYSIMTKRKFADSTYKNVQVLEFNVNLPKTKYMNFNSVHISLPIKMKSKADKDNNIPARKITGDSLFAN